MSTLKFLAFVLITFMGITGVEAGSAITYDIRHQYTTDGWLQHVAVYSDAVICTNLAGPRKDLQIIILSNGAMDMCHKCKHHKTHFTHKYAHCEVNTYNGYQIATW